MTKDEALRLALDWFKCYQDKSMSRNNAEELADEISTAIKTALEAKDEPVGDVTCWTVKGNLKNHEFDYYGNLPDGTHLLYTTSPQRKPLTDEQVDAIWPLHTFIQAPDRQWLAFARAIEAAHGIKE